MSEESSGFQSWLIDWFEVNVGEKLDPDIDLFSSQVLDSFQMIILIEDIETELSCRFTQSLLQDQRLATIRGLAEIMANLSMKNG
jgi:acyl carrier protein